MTAKVISTNCTVRPMPLSREQAEWIEAAKAKVSKGALAELLVEIVNLHSPTGRERPLAEFLVSQYQHFGLEGTCQVINDNQANAIGKIRGRGDGVSLMLFSMIDTAFDGSEPEYLEHITTPDWRLPAQVDGDYIIGLCAENPKAYVVCQLAAAAAVQAAGVPLRGDLQLSHCAGGMPMNQRNPDGPANHGQGVGCSFMLERGYQTDLAIICKPGWAVAWEEVGVCWFKLMVRGAMSYTGIRQWRDFARYDNVTLRAIPLLQRLEKWFTEVYAPRNTSGLCAPQGSIGAIHGGFPHMPIFTPAALDLYLDIRVGPRSSPMQVKRELDDCLDEIRRDFSDLDVKAESILSLPGAVTDADSWVIQSTMRAWEAVTQRPHEPILNTAGVTDASILRNRGIPTARVGMPPPGKPVPAYSGTSMGFADVKSMLVLTELLIHTIVDTCTRPREAIFPREPYPVHASRSE